jgi:hypothetical protein
MEGKLVKLGLSEGYRLDDLNGNYIASTLNGKNKLSLKNCEAIENGYDLEELAKESVNEVKEEHTDFTFKEIYMSFFKEGFQKALEILGDKKFSEKDMSKAWSEGYHRKVDELNGNGLRYFDKFIQSLQQTEWNVIVEMECPECKEYGYISECRNECNKKFTQPKLDADGCLILKRK